MEIKSIVTILLFSILGLSLGANASIISSDDPWVDATEGSLVDQQQSHGSLPTRITHPQVPWTMLRQS
ncbi:MAG: hypothetical protein CM15mP82_4820 [Methanobacteriota archaeon]|nr:MAG: hypothetical protein CM15mP82_4820 [Euryarchaeota archaeon]